MFVFSAKRDVEACGLRTPWWLSYRHKGETWESRTLTGEVELGDRDR